MAAAHHLARHIPDARLHLFEGRGHLPIFTATAEFCEILRRFVMTGMVSNSSPPQGDRGGRLTFGHRGRDGGAPAGGTGSRHLADRDSLREENRHAVLRERPCPHPLPGSRFRLPPDAHPWRRPQFSPLILADSVALQPDGEVQGRLPLYLRRSAQCQPRPIPRPAADRPPVGRLHRRPARADGPPRYPRVHGHGLLHRRAEDPQPHSAGSGARRRGRDDAAQRVRPEIRTFSTRTTSRAGGRRCARSAPISR